MSQADLRDAKVSSVIQTKLSRSSRREAKAGGRAAALLLAGAVILCAVSLFIRRPYFHCYFAGDDLNLLAEIGLAQCGRLSWSEGWCQVIGPHLMILWKIVFACEWVLFGLNPAGFHGVVALIHGLSGALLFWLARQWGIGRFAAAITALAWSGAAIGGWDNPTLWHTAGGIALGLLFLLAAICCAVRLASRFNPLAVVGMAVFWSLSILTWSDMALLAPVLVLALVDRGLLRRGRRQIVIGLLMVGLPAAAMLPLIAYRVSGEIAAPGRAAHLDPLVVAWRTASQLAISLGSLTYGYVAVPDTVLQATAKGIEAVSNSGSDSAIGGRLSNSELRADESLPPKFGLMVFIGAAGLGLRRRLHWRLVTLFFLLAMLYLAAANIGGFSMSNRDAINQGHYLYFASLFWCVLFGCIVDAAGNISAVPRPLNVVLVGSLLAAFLAHQSAVARESAKAHDLGFGSSTSAIRDLEQVLKRLAESGRRNGQTVRLPDTPVGINAGYYPCWPLAAFSDVCFPKGLAGLEVVRVQDVSPVDLAQATRQLDELRLAPAGQLAETMRQVYPLLKALVWLDRQVSQRSSPIEIPDGKLPMRPQPIAIAQLGRYQLSPAVSRQLQFKDVGAAWSGRQFRRQFPRLAALLQTSSAPEAAYLSRLFEPVP